MSVIYYTKQKTQQRFFNFVSQDPDAKVSKGAKYLTPSSARVLRTIERPKDDFEEVSCLWLSICTKNVFYVARAMLPAVKSRSRSNFWSNKWRDPTNISQLNHRDFDWNSMILHWDSRLFMKWVPGLTIAICNKIIALSANSGSVYSRWPQDIFLYPGGHKHWLGLTHVPPFWQGILQMAAWDKKIVGYAHLLSVLCLKTGVINGLYNLRPAPERTTKHKT